MNGWTCPREDFRTSGNLARVMMVDKGSPVWDQMASAEARKQRKGTGKGEWTERIGERTSNFELQARVKHYHSTSTAQQSERMSKRAKPKHLRSLSPDNPSVGGITQPSRNFRDETN